MESKNNISNLTNREFEVMQKVSIGKPNKEIAYELGCVEDTIKSHLRHAFPKLDAQNRVEATIKFMEITGKLKNETE